MIAQSQVLRAKNDAKNDVNIGICMENGQKMIKKADKISELTPIFLKFHTKQVQRNTNKMSFSDF